MKTLELKDKTYKLTRGNKWNCFGCDLNDEIKGCMISSAEVSHEIAINSLECEEESFIWKLVEHEKEISFDYDFCPHCLIHIHKDKLVYKNDEAYCPTCNSCLSESEF